MNRSILNSFILLNCLFITACSSAHKDVARIVNGKLLPCPSSPNCVSSQAKDPEHKTDAIRFEKKQVTDLHQTILDVLKRMDRATVVSAKPNHIHAVFTTKLFRFKDDVDFLIDADNGLIHIRSASRTGYSDFGVNGKRVETIRKQIKESLEKE